MGSTAEAGWCAARVNLDKFFTDIEFIKDELKELDDVYFSLQYSHEQSKTLHNASAVKDLRSRMDADVTLALKKAKVLKLYLEVLDRSNAANRSLPNCRLGSSSDRTRISVFNGLRKKLNDSMDSFNALRQKISSEYRETVQRKYYTVFDENPDEKTLDLLISTEALLFVAIPKDESTSLYFRPTPNTIPPPFDLYPWSKRMRFLKWHY
ncbi:syntaxin-121-like [Malus sylvestris]|uniref:syntaxin-121-like n=1 Tax=Malus sylvestris TaxID=3752 RepID=UPI0021AC1FF3|nr:syntaxin-121-like [Malus sylvestris]